MKKIVCYISIFLSVSTVLYAVSEDDIKNIVKPKTFVVDTTQCVGIPTSTTTICGKKVVLNWSPSPSECLYFSPDNGGNTKIEFRYYLLQVFTHGTTEVLQSYEIHSVKQTSIQLPDFTMSGVYDISIAPYYERYVQVIFWIYQGWWWTSNGVNTITVVVDHMPPLPPTSLPTPKNNSLPDRGWQKTNENTSVDGTPNYVNLTWKPATDSGPQENDGASGIAGYQLYEGDVQISACLSDAVYPEDVTLQVPLSEGEHLITLKAFDHIAYLENNENIKTVAASGPSSPSMICVDRSGPEAVVITADSLKIIDGKEIPFVINSAGVSWNVPNDLPALTENGTTRYIGIGASTYEIAITKTDTVLTRTFTQNTTNFTIPNDLVSGKYSIFVTPIDRLGNRGTANTPITFCVDNTRPPALDPDSFQIDDPLAQKTPGTATFQTKQRNCVITFAAVSDGNDEYASGIAGYRLYRENGAVTNLTSTSIAISGLNPGTNNFTVTAVDKAGNESMPAVSLILVVPTLQPVTFPTPCYILESNIYYLRWNVPVDANGPAAIDHYQVIVQARSQAAPDYAAFSSKVQVTVQRSSLEGVDQGVDLAAYVLAVAQDGGWSIGSKEFSLPPINGTGTQPRTLTEDEYWGPGIYDLNQSIIVPSGKTLFILDDTTVRVQGVGDIFIQVDGKLNSAGGSTGIIFLSAKGTPGTKDWKGIIASGEVKQKNTTIQNAERGITALQGSNIAITNGAFISCRIGIHAGTDLSVTSTRFQTCEWYAVKEDAIVNDKRPKLINCRFKGNGNLYYHITGLILNITQLNGLNGNADNSEEQ